MASWPPIPNFEHNCYNEDSRQSFGFQTFWRQIIVSNFTNFSGAATLLTLQIIQTGNKENFVKVSRVEDAILGLQLQKSEKKEHYLMRKK
jgi:Holliday junction resolvasome RuvABC DNA-binding subunit